MQYCDPAGQECKEPAEDATEQLSGTADSPLQISVPADVADTPWQVVFVYEDADGNEVDSRSPVFSPGERYAYTLHLPDDAAELRHVEVQRFSAVLTAGPEGGVDFGIGGSWVVEMN